MPSVLWVHTALDPLGSGELRRLGVPALTLDGDELTCRFAPAALVGREPSADVAVVPLSAAHAIPRLAGGPATRVIIEIDLRTSQLFPEASAILAGLANRIVGVVARGARVAAWANRILGGSVQVWIIPDPAARRVELAAAALHLGLPQFGDLENNFEDPFELWFSEPGDHIETEEVERLARAWSTGSTGRVVIAPRFVGAWLAQAGVRARVIEWSPDVLSLALSAASRCFFPGPEGYGDARRRVTALRAGAAVSPPLSPPSSAFEPAQVAASWRQVLSAAQSGRGSGPAPKAVVLLDLIQDLDPLLPILDALVECRELQLQIVVTNWLRRRSPRVAAELAGRALAFDTVERSALVQGAGPSLQGVDVVLTVADSDLSAHAPTHALINRARSAGIPTVALQHGLENVGLHHVEGEEDASVAADHFMVWFPPEYTPASVPAALRPRLVHIGRPAPVHPDLSDLGGAFAAFSSIVAVFENLHWARYDPPWRTRFLADCAEFAFSHPDLGVVLKPHHAGLWSVKNRHLIPEWPTNLIVADPTDPFWEPYTAGALVHLADAVITTPSTVALDAAQAGRPVAVAAYGLELPIYAPLPMLQTAADWTTFLAQAGSVEDARRRGAFLSRAAHGHDPARSAARYLAEVARQGRSMRDAARSDRAIA